MKPDKEIDLFNVKVDLIVFEALQQDGTLSFEKLADKTKIHPTTVQYAVERLRKRDFYEIKAVPRLEKFQHRILFMRLREEKTFM